MDLGDEIYPGGYYKLVGRLERRAQPFDDPLAVLPVLNSDFNQYFNALTDESITIPEGDRCNIQRKWAQLCTEFAGQPQVLPLHAILIAILRRDDPPQEARNLFLRLWHDEGTRLTPLLTTRWLIAAATTFADHGDTVEQRLAGQGLSLLFDLIKLHDSERHLSGQNSTEPFNRGANDAADIAFDMAPYAMRKGDLDKNLLARLWRLCEDDATIRPLGVRMLRMVMTDKRSIFARLQRFKSAASILDYIPGDSGQ